MTAMDMERHKDREKGFTFVELIVAVTIFSIIAVSIYSTFSAGLRVWRRTNPVIEANQSARFFFNIIAMDLKNAVKYTAAKDEPNFEGDDKRIAFITLVDMPAEDGRARKELAKVIYELKAVTEEKKERYALIRSVAAAGEALDEKKAFPSEVMSVASEKDFGFKYAYIEGSPKDKEYSYRWKDEWEEEDRTNIPRGVKIKAGSFEKTVFIPMGSLGDII